MGSAHRRNCQLKRKVERQVVLDASRNHFLSSGGNPFGLPALFIKVTLDAFHMLWSNRPHRLLQQGVDSFQD